MPKNDVKYQKNGGKNGGKNFDKAKKKRKFWVVKIFILTFFIAIVFSLASNAVMNNLNLWMALVAIAIIVLIGVVFDAVGIAITAASNVPFVSMASKKIRGASEALQLIKNADQVSNFCNDVVGDVCGIISGSAGIILFLRIASLGRTLNRPFLSIIISSLIAALTVGGKAFGKAIAIRNSQRIVHITGILLSYIDKNSLVGRKEGKRIRS